MTKERTGASAHPQDRPITPELVAEHGLTVEEYGRIREILGREPTYTELGVFSALWSEHCGYKNSKPLLREFPTEAPWVLQGPGENAGVIEVGEGWAVAFKIESHNRPSAVAPYNGAATGVGGILRDVFTMGARPVAVLNSLRFGPLTDPHVRYLFAEAVRGMADYGRGVGVPTVGGEVYFDEAYQGNPLVNAMALGVLRREELIRGEAEGPGNPILAVGAPTDRAGIHGATFATAELEEDASARREQIPAGNPELERRLMEASLALIRSGHIVGIQDMGAAGVASSSSEMAARSGTGVDIDTALVPTHVPAGAPPMTPYEILLSETQERMLVVAKAGHEEAIRELLAQWELEPAVIGHVTDDGLYRVREGERVVCEIPGEELVAAPTNRRPARESAEAQRLREWDPGALEHDATTLDVTGTLRQLLAAPTIASKRWAYEQFTDEAAGADASGAEVVVGPGQGAGVIRIPGTTIGIAATVDCNGRYCALNPRRGGMIAVAEAARNLACMGARPRATTDNLNFGSPLDPAVYYQLSEAVAGISEACRAFETPVVSGNVSLFNESPTGAIYPTPTIGMVGVLDDVERVLRPGFRATGDAIILLGRNTDELGGSEYLKVLHGLVAGDAPAVDLPAERALQEAMLELAGAGLARSAHDTAEGGLSVALAESALAAPGEPLGVEVELHDDLAAVPLLFGEAQGRIVVSCAPEQVEEVLAVAARHGVPATRIGTVGVPGGRFRIGTAKGVDIEVAVLDLAAAYFGAIPALMAQGR
jgi:phosphoribosylformylglycinamidine synthase